MRHFPSKKGTCLVGNHPLGPRGPPPGLPARRHGTDVLQMLVGKCRMENISRACSHWSPNITGKLSRKETRTRLRVSSTVQSLWPKAEKAALSAAVMPTHPSTRYCPNHTAGPMGAGRSGCFARAFRLIPGLRGQNPTAECLRRGKHQVALDVERPRTPILDGPTRRPKGEAVARRAEADRQVELNFDVVPSFHRPGPCSV